MSKLNNKILNYYKENVIQIKILYFKSLYKNNKKNTYNCNSALDYHLHLIYTNAKKDKNYSVFCLDTSDTLTSNLEYSCSSEEHVKFLTETMAELFIDKLASIVKVKSYKKELLFFKACQELWNLFNDLKETSFMEKLKL